MFTDACQVDFADVVWYGPGMATLYAVCAVLGALAGVVGAVSLLYVALAVRAAGRDARGYLARISGSVAAARELVKRAAAPERTSVEETDRTRWTRHLPREWQV